MNKDSIESYSDEKLISELNQFENEKNLHPVIVHYVTKIRDEINSRAFKRFFHYQ